MYIRAKKIFAENLVQIAEVMIDNIWFTKVILYTEVSGSPLDVLKSSFETQTLILNSWPIDKVHIFDKIKKLKMETNCLTHVQ